MASVTSLSSFSPDDTVLKLPHPYQLEFAVQRAGTSSSSSSSQLFQLVQRFSPDSKATPVGLATSNLLFTDPIDLKSSEVPPSSNNSAWGRARRAPAVECHWSGEKTPTLAQAWLLLYVLFTVRPGMETVRLEMKGKGASVLGQQLKDVLLAVEHPTQPNEQRPAAQDGQEIVLALRSTFWQGAGSPFGPRPVWCPSESPASLTSPTLSSYPLTPFLNTTSIQLAGDPQDPERKMQAWHPIRPAKPAPGSVIYSRWIPHLKETFSMVALDWENAEHLRLFHEWQNDPRVSQGWNETGTLEQHREYLRKIHVDPHQVAVLAKWEDTYFAYFETYWAKEDRLGAYFNPGDFDRGRHSLVGDVRFRGPHRVTAWWSSLMHYLFLDDPRTMALVGEPKDTNSTVVMYDLIHGFGLEKFVDLPHKRSALVRCTRERFFQLCPLGESEKAVGGMGIGLVPKL